MIITINALAQLSILIKMTTTMSQSTDFHYKSRKWLREPSSCTRIVVIVIGVSTDHIDLMHHGFSCFENIALMHIDTTQAGQEVVRDPRSRSVDRAEPTALFDTQISECACCVVVAGELDECFLHDFPLRKVCVYPIAEGARAQRSVIDVVEKVKSLARVAHSRRVETASLLHWASAR